MRKCSTLPLTPIIDLGLFREWYTPMETLTLQVFSHRLQFNSSTSVPYLRHTIFLISKQLLWFVVVPSQPRDVNTKLDKGEISVTWKDPQDHNGIITEYSVSYTAKIRSISNLSKIYSGELMVSKPVSLHFSLGWKLSCNHVRYFLQVKWDPKQQPQLQQK